jgi:hypothetical protein
MQRVRRRFALASTLLLPIAMAIVLSISASAYGPANWQAAFSGNFNNATAGGGGSGFWGWCEFAGGVLSGGDADCSTPFYFHPPGNASNGFLLNSRIHGSAWDTEATTFPSLAPGVNDFFINAGTVTLTGPNIAKALAAGFVPPGCTLGGSTLTCPIPVLEAAGLFMPDTGIPAQAGHFSLQSIAEMVGFAVPPGTHIDIQVTQIH